MSTTQLDLSLALQQFNNMSYQPLEISIDKNMYESFLSKYANAEFLGKFINVCLYQSDFTAVSGINNNNEVIQYFKLFLKSLGDDIKSIKNTSINTPIKPFTDTIIFINNILNIKDDATARLINYDTVSNHFTNLNPFTKQIITDVSINRIDNFQKFKSELEDISKLISVYHELRQVRFISDEMEVLKVEATNNNISPLNLLKTYKEIIHRAYTVFSTLKSVSGDDEDKYLEFYDETFAPETADKLLQYLSQSFNFYMSGYDLLDKHIDGIESSSVYIIAAASNNGKSLFMINLMRNMIRHQLNNFEPNDLILFVTLEDDIYKLFRRIICIFGNINPKLAKKLFVYCSSLLRAQSDIEITRHGLQSQIKILLEKIINKTLHKVTKGKCRIGLMHSNEFGYSASDISRFIEKKKVEGLNVKSVFVDYLDCMSVSNVISSSNGWNKGSEYDSQGTITQELRLLAREKAISIITVTQNNKLSENSNQALNNALVGDSLMIKGLYRAIYKCKIFRIR